MGRLPVNVTVIHHSETEGSSTTQGCIKIVKSIQIYHMDTHGWDDIGYNFLVGGDGNAYEGRGWGVRGAHAPGYNSTSIGICLIGSFSSNLPSDGQLTAAKDLIDYGVSKGYIKSGYLLYGHRDVRNTTCPGDALYNEISTWSHKAPAP